MIKTIALSEDNWRYLQNLKTKYNFKKIDDLMELLLTHIKDAIKKGDLEIGNNF